MIVKVQAKNFLSWETLDFDIQSGVTLIDGWNEDDQTPEGSGKSAILNAISWCLYGKLPKDVKIDDVIKRGESSCVVAVRVDSTTIIRSRKPNELCMVLQDTEVIKGKDAKETQDLIEARIGLSFETFCQTVYFAQNYTKKFITANQEEKGKILSEVQDLTVFDRARKEVLELIKVSEATQTKTKHSIELLAKDIQLLEGKINTERVKIEQAELRRKLEIDTLVSKFDTLEAELGDEEYALVNMREYQSELRVSPDKIQELSKHGEDVVGRMSLIKSQMSNIDKLVKSKSVSQTREKFLLGRYNELVKQRESTQEFINNPTSICPTCNSTLENCDTSRAQAELTNIDVMMSNVREELEGMSEELRAPVPTKESLSSEYAQLTQIKSDVDSQLSALRKVQTQLTTMEAKISAAEKSLNVKATAMVQVREQLAELRAKPIEVDLVAVEKLTLEVADSADNRARLIALVGQTYQHLKRLEALKDGFKEIKSFVFNSMLNEINSKVHQYLTHLFEVPASVRFRNDNMKIETDVTFDGVERGLGLLSGGQFRRVSLAVDLALADVITARKGATLGVLILDEYFKDLSEQSMEKCLTLLESRGQPVLLIEHNSIFKNVVNNSFFVRLQGGTSRAEV